MPNYTAPVDDMLFLFEKLRDNKNYNELEKYNEVSSDLVKDILEEAAKINQNLILPLAKIGDENPAILENGVVRTPPGYKEAYQKYIEDGWTSLSCDPKYGFSILWNFFHCFRIHYCYSFGIWISDTLSCFNFVLFIFIKTIPLIIPRTLCDVTISFC